MTTVGLVQQAMASVTEDDPHEAIANVYKTLMQVCRMTNDTIYSGWVHTRDWVVRAHSDLNPIQNGLVQLSTRVNEIYKEYIGFTNIAFGNFDVLDGFIRHANNTMKALKEEAECTKTSVQEDSVKLQA